MAFPSSKHKRAPVIAVLLPLGFSYREIARAIGCSEAGVKKDIRKGGKRGSRSKKYLFRNVFRFYAKEGLDGVHPKAAAAIEAYLGSARAYWEGICAGYEALQSDDLPDGPETRLLRMLFCPIEEPPALPGWDEFVASCAERKEWPRSERDLREIMTERFRTTANRNGISGNSSKSLRERLYAAMDELLTDREKFVLRHHYGLAGTEAKTLHEIGSEMELSREAVRQIELDAQALLRGYRWLRACIGLPR